MEAVKKEASAPVAKSGGKMAVILIRSVVGSKSDIKDTLKMLNLLKKNSCSVVEKTPSVEGMLKKVQDYTTYGDVDEATLKELVEKRGKGKEQKFYSLHPPRKGFERKGIKIQFRNGGALGYRGAKINDLIKRML